MTVCLFLKTEENFNKLQCGSGMGRMIYIAVHLDRHNNNGISSNIFSWYDEAEAYPPLLKTF